jgi:hypothetical protein
MSDPHIELRVRLTDGTFDSCITVTIKATGEARNAFIRQWLSLMNAALELQREAQAAPEPTGDQS